MAHTPHEQEPLLYGLSQLLSSRAGSNKSLRKNARIVQGMALKKSVLYLLMMQNIFNSLYVTDFMQLELIHAFITEL